MRAGISFALTFGRRLQPQIVLNFLSDFDVWFDIDKKRNNGHWKTKRLAVTPYMYLRLYLEARYCLFCFVRSQITIPCASSERSYLWKLLRL